MKTSNEERKRRILFKPKNEKGSVTVFVLIAMLFFLTVGIIIFITNMNNSANQKKDTSKIQKDYDNVSSGNLNTIYDEQEAKVTGSIQIIVRDSEGNLYKDGVWTNKEPLTIEVVWPKEIKNNAPNGTRQIVIMRGLTPTTYNENQIENVLLSQDGTYNIFAQVNDNKAQVTVRIDHSDPNAAFSQNGGRLFVDPDNHKLIDTVQITASDEYSGVKTVEYLISTSATEPAANDENWKNYTAAIDEIPNVEDGEFYYIYAKVTDNAGNVKIEKSKEYTAVIANYEIKKGDNIQYAETLKEAVDNAATGSTIKLLRDYTDESNVTVKDNKSIVFDNNGKTLTKTTAGITINAEATLEIAGSGTITTAEGINIINNSGTLNITHTGTISDTCTGNTTLIANRGILNKTGSGTITSATALNTIGNYGSSSAVATISAGTVSNTGTGRAIHTYNGATLNVSGTANITAATGNTIIFGHPSSNSNGILNMTGGTITSDSRYAIAVVDVEETQINISGGTITGKRGVIDLGVGTATITGGTITASAGPGISATSGTVTIGTSEGNAPNNENPSITGSTYGVEITTGELNYYSGKIVGTQTTTVKGREVAFKIDDESKVTYRTGYGAHTTKEGNIYTTTLSDDFTVTLDANGSTIPETEGWTNAGDNKTATKVIKYNTAYGTLPTPTKAGYLFRGWTGKNLLNPAELDTSKNIVANEDGSVHARNTTSDPRNWNDRSKDNWKLTLPAGTYTMSVNFVTQTSAVSSAFQIRNRNNDNIISFDGLKDVDKITRTFTLTEETNIGIMLKIYDGVANIQLERATTATEYEPYHVVTAETIMNKTEDHTLYAHWEEAVATFVYGQTLNVKMKTLAGDANPTSESEDTNIKTIRYSSTLPSEYENDNYKVSVDAESNTPIYMWFDNGTIYWHSEDFIPYINASAWRMFDGLTELTEIEQLKPLAQGETRTTGFDTSKTTNMTSMFAKCKKLTGLDLKDFDTIKVTSMNSMFYNCNALTNLDVSQFDTSKVTNMQATFNGCSSLTSLNVSSFNTSSVTNMSYMFADCSSLTNLDVSNFDTSKVTDISRMFRDMTSLTTLNLGNLNTSSATNMRAMFTGCGSLQNIDVSSFDTSKVTNMSFMFHNCRSLTTLDVSNFDTSNVTDMSVMFYGCGNLTTIYATDSFVTDKFEHGTDASGNIINSTDMFSGSTKLVGGAGTKYNKDNVDKTYAHIDGKGGQAGYFTNHYYVEFNGNGGKTTENKETSTQGIPFASVDGSGNPIDTQVKLNKNPFIREGYIFRGWSKTADGAVEFTNEQAMNYTLDGIKAIAQEKPDDKHVKLKLYAIWSEQHYEVTTGATTTPAETLVEALTIAQDGSTIKVTADYTDNSVTDTNNPTQGVLINKNVTIDQDGKKLTMANTMTVASGKTATFIDTAATKGKIERTTGGLITNNGTVNVGTNGNNGANLASFERTIEGATVNMTSGSVECKGTKTTADVGAIWCDNFTMSGGNVLRTGGNQNDNNVSGNTVFTYNNCTVSGGKITGYFGINGQAGKVKISNSANIDTKSLGIYGASNLEITVEGGTISGWNAILLQNKQEKLTIVGGTLTGKNNPAIRVNSDNNTVIIGNKDTALSKITPEIKSTNGYGIEISKDTSTLEFYSGKIVGKSTSTVKGRDVAFSIADENKVTYREGCRTVTTENNGTYTTKLSDEYTVTLDNQSATTAGTTSVQAQYNQPLPDITVPTKAGYTFKGYYIEKEMTSSVGGIAQIGNGDTRINLMYDENNWAKTSEGDTGVNIQGKIIIDSVDITESSQLENSFQFNDKTISVEKIEKVDNKWAVDLNFDINSTMLTGDYASHHRFIDIKNLTNTSTITVEYLTKHDKKYYYNVEGKGTQNSDITDDITLYAHWADETAPAIASVTPSTTWDIENYVDFNATDAGSGIVAYNITETNTAPTNWIPVIADVEATTETKYEKDAAWARVFHHNSHWGSVMFSNANDWAEAKTSNTVDKYSVLINLEKYRNKSGVFEFMLQYPEVSATQYNRWRQTDNPATVRIPDAATDEEAKNTFVGGYTKDFEGGHIDWSANCWGGLALSTYNVTFINGSVGHINWFYAIGSRQAHQGGIPGIGGKVASTVNLWARIDDKDTTASNNLTRRLGDLKENKTYYVWVKDDAGNTSSKAVTISKVDTTKPTATITAPENASASQSITLTLGDDKQLAKYYWGTSNPEKTNVTWVDVAQNVTTSATLTQTVNAAGTYYLGVQDAAGNRTVVSKKFNEITYMSGNLIKPIPDRATTTEEWLEWSIQNEKVTAKARRNDGYSSSLPIYVHLEAGKKYHFSCTTDGVWGVQSVNGGDSVEALIMKYGEEYSYYIVMYNNEFDFTPTQTAEYTIRLDVNLNGAEHTFENLQIYEYYNKVILAENTALGVLPTNPSLEGHTFRSWYTEKKGQGTQVTTATVPTTNTVYYSKFEINKYNVTYDKNFLENDKLGRNTIDTSKYSDNICTSTKTIVENLSAKYGKELEFTFTNITNNESGSVGPWISHGVLDTNKKYTWSVYVKASKNITMNIGSNQGSGNKNVNITTDWQRVEYTFTPKVTTHNAFRFYGEDWQVGDKLYIHSLELAEVPDGKETALNVTTINQNYASPLDLTAPTREGYTFKGWYTAPVGGTKLEDGATTPAEDVTYYAQWEIQKYTISYELNGGAVSPANPTEYYVDSSTFILNNPTKASYTFLGWNEEITNMNWYKGFINISTGAIEIDAEYPNAYYTNMIKLKAGVTYTLSKSYSTGWVRWRIYNLDGTYRENVSSTKTYTPDNDCYIRLLYPANPTAENMSGTKITSTIMPTVEIPKGSQGNRKYTANWAKLTLSENTIYVKTGGTGVIAKEGTAAASTAQVTYTVEGTDALDFTSQNTDVATVETTDNVTATVTGIGVTDGGTTKIIFIDKTTGVKLGELNVKIDITPPDWLINFVSIIRGESTT